MNFIEETNEMFDKMWFEDFAKTKDGKIYIMLDNKKYKVLFAARFKKLAGMLRKEKKRVPNSPDYYKGNEVIENRKGYNQAVKESNQKLDSILPRS